MNIQTPLPKSHQSWEEVRKRLDQNAPFSNMFDTPYYRDAVYDHFSKEEYARRYAALRDKMRAHKLDCVIVPGGPSHWSFGGGMQWLTGHWEWHAIASYVVVPLDGEPTPCPMSATAAAASMPKSWSSGSKSSSSSAVASGSS